MSVVLCLPAHLRVSRSVPWPAPPRERVISMYTWRALQLYYFCTWSLALVLSWTSLLIFGSGGFGVPCWLVAPLGPLGLAGDLQQNTQGHITNYRNNNRHLTSAGGGGLAFSYGFSTGIV